MTRRTALARALVATGLLAIVVITPAASSLAATARPQANRADGNQSLLSGEAEAYAYRVEYDLPIPAGTGTIAHVSATAQRSPSVETSHGLAAAPSHLDAVVSGKYGDPQGTGHPVNKLPQVECNFPSSEPTHFFKWPTDTQANTAGAPATSYAYASCGAGPAVELRSRAADPASGDPATAAKSADAVGAYGSEASIRPDHGKLVTNALSSADDLSFGGGLIKIGSVRAVGTSVTEGTPGTASSTADIIVSDITVGATTFSLAFSGVGVVVTAGGTSVPFDTTAGHAVLDAANTSLAGTGCSLTVVRDPARYPQGFLFSRPQPELGVKDDGSMASSYRGGLLVVCDVPDNPIAQATKFSPERFQALVGFVYTSVIAKADIGGFGFADLIGSIVGGLPMAAPPAAPAPVSAAPVAVAAPAPAPVVAPPAAPAPAPPAADDGPLVLTSFLAPLPAPARWGLGIVGLAVWGWLTHLGLTRLLATGARVVGS